MRRLQFCLAFTLASCAQLDHDERAAHPANTDAVASAATTYRRVDCDKPYDTDPYVECGKLSVPQRHATASPTATPQNNAQRPTASITIPVVRLRSGHRKQPRNPLVVLGGGGPGAPIGTDSAAIGRHKSLFAEVIDAGRDVIIVEQRGVGRSRPSTFCFAGFNYLQELFSDLWPPERALQIQIDGTTACREELAARGVDIGAYTNHESLADIESLRKALEIDQWVLFGGSAAATLALGTLRRHPRHIEAVVLDSPSPPEHGFLNERYQIYDDAFRRLLETCTRFSSCNTDYPMFGETLRRVLNSLREQPLVLKPKSPLDQQPMRFVVDADRLLDVFFLSLYWREAIIDIPRLVTELDNGRDEALVPVLEEYLRLFTDANWGDGLWLTIQCREKLPFTTADARTRPSGVEFFPFIFDNSLGDMSALCMSWRAGEPIKNSQLPISSDTPTLILSGQLDPITPTRIAHSVHRRLPNSQLVVFPNYGHSVSMTNTCAMDVIVDFLDNWRSPIENDCIRQASPLKFN